MEGRGGGKTPTQFSGIKAERGEIKESIIAEKHSFPCGRTKRFLMADNDRGDETQLGVR